VTQLYTPPPEIVRDRLGRPLVIPPGQEHTGATVPYSRVTTFVGAIEDRYNLEKWQQRMVIIGLTDSPELLLSAAAHRDDKNMLNTIAEDAQMVAKARAPATIGTAVHKFIADIDRGLDVGLVPGDYERDLNAYQRATVMLKHLHVEQFMVNDDLLLGGTPDRIVELWGKRFIADAKTGDISRPGKIAMQLACYAHSKLYDVTTHTRTPIDVDQNNAIIIHLPAGTGECTLYWVNIAAGWDAVQLAHKVRQWRAGQNQLVAPFRA
jgi:hypothetical protein